MREQAGTLEAFLRRMVEEREGLAAFAERVSRFFGGVRPSVPVYLIANPSEGQIGGGFNGGRLTLEVPTGRDAYPSLLHEVFHAFLEDKRPAMRKAAVRVKGLDEQTLNEGLAYALAPGMIHPQDGPRDPLRDQVAADWAAGKSMGDDYTRFNRFGLALRPLLTGGVGRPLPDLRHVPPQGGRCLDGAVRGRRGDGTHVGSEGRLRSKAGIQLRSGVANPLGAVGGEGRRPLLIQPQIRALRGSPLPIQSGRRRVLAVRPRSRGQVRPRGVPRPPPAPLARCGSPTGEGRDGGVDRTGADESPS